MTFAPKENGTQLTYAAQIRTNGLFKFLEGMLGKQAEKQEGSNIDAVKQLLEGG